MFRHRKDKKVSEDTRRTLDWIHRDAVAKWDVRGAPDKRTARTRLAGWLDYYTRNYDLLAEYYRQDTARTSIASSFFGAPAGGAGTSSAAKTKDQLLDEYCSRNDPSWVAKRPAAVTHFCEDCRADLEDGICVECGREWGTCVVAEGGSWKERSGEKANFNYRRINHFNEIMAQLLTRQNVEIPEEVLARVAAELRKMRFTDMTKLDQELVRDILKKAGFGEYYDHVMLIIAKLSGKSPEQPDDATLERLNGMFNEAQSIWHLYKPDDRRNLLTYRYVFYKLFELLELDEHKKYCPLLKTHEKLVEYDRIWRNICTHLRWEFIPTV